MYSKYLTTRKENKNVNKKERLHFNYVAQFLIKRKERVLEVSMFLRDSIALAVCRQHLPGYLKRSNMLESN